MNVGPIMKRELRAQARQPFTYWLRTAAVTVMLAAAVVFGFNNEFKPGLGDDLLAYLHGCLFAGIWILVPTMAADCLSRERREGTLSLLFLTNLKPFDIVLAKASAHALRAFTFWLATLPALTLPFLIGGAGWQHAVLSVLFNFMALCLALGAGLLASSRCQAWARACALALFTSAVLWFGFCMVNTVACAIALLPSTPGSRGDVWSYLLSVQGMANGLIVPVGGLRYVAQVPRAPSAQAAWFWAEGGMALASLLFLVICLWMASRSLARHWRDEPASAFARWLERRLCTPVVAVNFLKRSMRRALARNPVGWLEVRSCNARLTVWIWFGLIVMFYSLALSDVTPSGLRTLQPQAFIGWLLAGSIAFNAAGSFRRERETGVLELLLVSPLSVAEIVMGRLLGIWGQFLPATGLLIGISATLAGWAPSHRESDMTWFFGITFVTLPIVGLYFSLARQQFLSAVVWTLGVGLILPALIGPVSHWLVSVPVFPTGRNSLMTSGTPWQVVIAAFLWARLHRGLAERRFNLERSMS